VLSAQEVNFDK
jgi:serine/threonine protein kinase